ncbi:MAG: transposase [Bacteroidales bacterium]|nr:transposase [Bacteroidota bacterium]MBL6950290.1 transposase [Bacteroidales bacterium]
MNKRRKFNSAFKTKVAIEAIKEQKTLADLSVMFGVTQQQISNWKNEFLRRSTEIFSKREPDKELEKENEKLFTKIGRLEIENDWLKKKL